MLMMVVYLLVVAGIVGAAVWFGLRYLGPEGRGLFGAARDSRIGVSEVASVDGKRKLLLIRRDDVEHLVMTGGPIDVVIEQGIVAPDDAHVPMPSRPSAPVAHSREPRLSPAPQPSIAADPGLEAQPGFGRLRQRPAPAATSEAVARVDTFGQSVGGGRAG
jgi:flagellar protein FliO/FliZ